MSALATVPVLGTPRPVEGHRQYRLQPRARITHALSDQDLAAYRDRGFVVIRRLLSADEAAFFRDEADRMVAQVAALCRTHGRDPRHNLRLEWDHKLDRSWKIDPCTNASPAYAALARDPRITDRLCSIYDGFQPRLFKDKLILKPAGSHGNSRHQDYNWWQGLPRSCLTVSIALDATNRENGCTEMWTGHRRGFLHHADGERIDSAELPLDLLADEEHHHIELEPGDAAIFSCFTPHAAAPNRSASPRRALFLSYNDSRDGEHYAAHYDHMFWYRTVREERPDDFYLL